MLRNRRSLTNNSLRRDTKPGEELLQKLTLITCNEQKPTNTLTVDIQPKINVPA